MCPSHNCHLALKILFNHDFSSKHPTIKNGEHIITYLSKGLDTIVATNINAMVNILEALITIMLKREFTFNSRYTIADNIPIDIQLSPLNNGR